MEKESLCFSEATSTAVGADTTTEAAAEHEWSNHAHQSDAMLAASFSALAADTNGCMTAPIAPPPPPPACGALVLLLLLGGEAWLAGVLSVEGSEGAGEGWR